jgi:hypothetical protein
VAGRTGRALRPNGQPERAATSARPPNCPELLASWKSELRMDEAADLVQL